MFAIKKKPLVQANKEKAKSQKSSTLSFLLSGEKSAIPSIKLEDTDTISMSDEQFQQALNRITDNRQRERMLVSRLQHLQRMALELTQQLAELHAYDDIQSKSLSIKEI